MSSFFFHDNLKSNDYFSKSYSGVYLKNNWDAKIVFQAFSFYSKILGQKMKIFNVSVVELLSEVSIFHST